MIEYSMNGAWGKTIPSDELTKALSEFGVVVTVSNEEMGYWMLKSAWAMKKANRRF